MAFVSFEKDKPEIQVVGPILPGVWDARQQKNKCQCVIWAYPLHTPFFQMIRCELNFMHSASKKSGVFSPRQPHFLLLQSKKWRANAAASKEQSRGWTGVILWEKAQQPCATHPPPAWPHAHSPAPACAALELQGAFLPLCWLPKGSSAGGYLPSCAGCAMAGSFPWQGCRSCQRGRAAQKIQP